MYRKIQTFKRQGFLKAEIARKMELDPGTVAKYYEMTLDELVGHVRKEPSAETKRILYWYENVASEKERRIFYRLVDELRKTWA
jgi:hypothetical protein